MLCRLSTGALLDAKQSGEEVPEYGQREQSTHLAPRDKPVESGDFGLSSDDDLFGPGNDEPDRVDALQSRFETVAARLEDVEKKLVAVQLSSSVSPDQQDGVRGLPVVSGGATSQLSVARIQTAEKTLHALAEEKAEMHAAARQMGVDLKHVDKRLDTLAGQVVAVLEEEAKVRLRVGQRSDGSCPCHTPLARHHPFARSLSHPCIHRYIILPISRPTPCVLSQRLKCDEDEMRHLRGRVDQLDTKLAKLQTESTKQYTGLRQQLTEKIHFLARKAGGSGTDTGGPSTRGKAGMGGDDATLASKVERLQHELDTLRTPLQNEVLGLKEAANGVLFELHRHQRLYRDMLAEYSVVLHESYATRAGAPEQTHGSTHRDIVPGPKTNPCIAESVTPMTPARPSAVGKTVRDLVEQLRLKQRNLRILSRLPDPALNQTLNSM